MTHYQEALRQERAAYAAWERTADAWISDTPRSTEFREQRRATNKASTAHIKACNVLAKAIALLPPPKPNAQVLATAHQHTAKRDGLGWGFEHTAIEQNIAYRKWLRKASRKPSDLE